MSVLNSFIGTVGSLRAGGTIEGDVTISGDLTVSGGGSYAYSEVLTGDMKITNAGTTTGLEIEQDGVGTALIVNQDTDRNSIQIDTLSTGYSAIQI